MGVNTSPIARAYTGEEFAKALSDGTLKESIVRMGMVKPDAEDSTAILFAESGCGDWIKVPIDLIDEVTHLATAKCEDHEHPMVQIRFKEPEGSGAARLFADLARKSAQPFLGYGEGRAEELPLGTVSRQNNGDAVGGVGSSVLDDCGCLVRKYACRVVYIRYAPGKFVPILRCGWDCTHYECDLR